MLTLANLTKSYGSLRAVDGLSLEVFPGEVFGLLGPNGAGKSTTIGMAVGLIRPDSGQVTVAGAGSPTNPDVRKRIGVAPQELALYDNLTGEENLRFFAGLYDLGGRTAESVDAALDLVGLAPRRRDRVKTYSGGMKRRLNLAAAIVHDPPLLLLDEATAGVDPQSRNNILEVVRSLAEQGRTIIYTTHYMEEASRLCDRVGIIEKGKLLALGTPEELIRAHGGRSVVRVVGADGQEQRIESDDPLRDVARVMNADAAISNVSIDRPDLESVFLNLTGRSLRDG
jgi:ABC-2 type transport system ATP-binding protein